MTRIEVSDEVWQQLDPTAGQLSRRTVRRLRLAALAMVVLLAGVAAIWRSGVVVPRIEYAELAGQSAGWDPLERQFTVGTTVVNRGWTSVELTGAGRSGPGLELVEVRGAFPATLAPGASFEFVLVYKVTDCSAVPSDAWPVPVRVARSWGTYTAYVDLPELAFGAPDGARTYSGRDPYGKGWQFALAYWTCHPSTD